MKKSIKTLTKKAACIVNGNYFEEINPNQYRKSITGVASVVEDLQKQLRSHIFEMQVVSSQIDSSTDEIGEVLSNQKNLSEKIFKNSENLSQANLLSFKKVSESVNVSDEMGNNTKRLKQSIQTLLESSDLSKEIIHGQLNSIDKNIAIIENISESSKASIEYIDKLFNSTTKIAEILKTVQAFYAQTQLLSLNASIESARAGEAGAGFAVVANQIRTLAQNSSQSVNQISDIIEEIDFDINNVIEHAKLTQNNVATAVDNTTIIQDGLRKIDSTYSKVDIHIHEMREKLDANLELFNHLNSTIQESSGASQVVASEIDNINSHIQTLHGKTSQITKLEVDLKDTSRSLRGLTNKVQVDLLSEAKRKIEKQVSEVTQKLSNLIQKEWELKSHDRLLHKKILDKAIAENEQIEAIWTNNETGDFIYSNPPAGIANATIRDWFNESRSGNVYVSKIYISAISKNPCITISLPIRNDSQQIIGVFGADIGINYL
ncbi:MAG: uncharacterized protein K0R15_1573 [Clostridiales bacterium]|jgi:methyl-accepting chemotaxis protein|nr:uncharacterized protein [Clostridiales bacterium]